MGFTFNGKHSDLYNIGVIDIERSLKPEKRVFKTVIGGRDGTHDFSNNTYSNILVTFTCDYLGTDIGMAKNDIALWLSTSGELVLDGEIDKIYQANVYSDIPLSQIFYLNQFTLTFECFPFAMSLPKQISTVITEKGQETAFQVGGTARTPCTIIIKNTGTKPITNLRLTHRKEV